MSQVCYLLTSKEKFQQLVGNGCCNTDCQCHTGCRMSVGQKKIPVLCLPLENRQCSRLEETSQENQNESGSSGETRTKQVLLSGSQVEKLSLLKTLFPHIKLAELLPLSRSSEQSSTLAILNLRDT